MNKLQSFLFKNIYFNKERKHLFSFLSQGMKNGGTTRELLESINIEYDKNKNKFMFNIVSETLNFMEQEGYSDAEAMKKSGMITENEYLSIENISQAEPFRALEFINEKTKSKNNFKWAIGMLFFPVLLVLFGYFIFQPELQNLTKDLLEPVNSLSVKEIEIPGYFKDRTLFAIGILITLSLMIGLFIFVNLLKLYNQKLLFKIFRIFEREFVINNFEILLSLLKSGQSSMRAVELLADSKDDVVTRVIFSKIKIAMTDGDKKIFEVLGDYGLDSATISYMRSGEKNNALIQSVEMALEYNKEVYSKLEKILTKTLPLIGEIIMTIVLLKPILDIITVTTVGTMNFQV